MRIIAYLTGNPSVQGYKRREFLWMPEHKCYVHNGRPFTEKEFNQLVPAICKKHRDLYPQFRMLEEPPAETAAVAPTTASLQIDVPAPAPEITVEQAEALLLRLAPEKLRKAPRPAAAATASR